MLGEFSQEDYDGIGLVRYEPYQDKAMAALVAEVYKARKRLVTSGAVDWSLAILVPTKRLTRLVSGSFREPPAGMKAIPHLASIEWEAVILAAEVVAFLLQPDANQGNFEELIELLCRYFRGKGGDSPTQTDVREAEAIQRAHEELVARIEGGKSIRKNSMLVGVLETLQEVRGLRFTGDPDKDWSAVRRALKSSKCRRLRSIEQEVRNLHLLGRGERLRQDLSQDWRVHGSYANALAIAQHAFVQEHLSTSVRPESGVVVMNMHKAKGKQFSEVILFEGWPRMSRGQIHANFDRIVRGNEQANITSQCRQNMRVSVTRARQRTTILTPRNDPCVLLVP